MPELSLDREHIFGQPGFERLDNENRPIPGLVRDGIDRKIACEADNTPLEYYRADDNSEIARIHLSVVD